MGEDLHLVDEGFEIYELDRGWFNQNARFRPVEGCLKGAEIWVKGVESVGLEDYCIYWSRKLGMKEKGLFGSGVVLKPIEDLHHSRVTKDIAKLDAFSKTGVIQRAKQHFRELSESKGRNFALLRVYFLFTGVIPFDPDGQSEDDLAEISNRIVEGIEEGDGWSPLFFQFRTVSP